MINTNNFFKRNTSLRNPAAPYKKGKFVDQSPEYKSRVFSRVQESPLTKTLLSMRKNVFGIENALRGLFELDKKKQATDQKFDLAEKQEAKDKPKVKPKTPKIFGNIIERPKTGVMDAIKNFVTFTFLGWLFTRLQPFIDKVGGLVPLLENIMKFFSGLIVGTLDAFASFLKFGYDAKDTFDKKIEEIKKESEGIGKHFDNTLGELKAVFSGAIEVVNSFLNTSVDEEELKTARQDVPKDSPETNIPPPPKLPDVATVSPSSSAASNINGDSPTGKTSSQTAPMPTTSPTIYKVNTGGRIDPTKTPITRGVEQKERRVIRRKPDIQQQKTVPGKDVGGEDKVKEVYGEETGTFKPDFIPNSIFFRTENKSGYAGLLKAAEEYKRPNDRDVLGLGNLMGATVDTALGQKLERRTITQFADGIKYLVEQGMSNPEEFKKIDLELMLRRIIEPKIEAAINKIRDEVNKKSKEKPTDGGPGGLDGGGGLGAVSGNEYERALLDLIAETEGTIGSYGTLYGGSVNKDLESGALTVAQTIELANRTAGVVGRYQFQPGTLMDLVNRLKVLKLDEKFTPEKQDQAALALARDRGVDPSKALSIEDMYRLGGVWAAIEGGPQMRKGGSYGNQARYSAEKALQIYNKNLETVRRYSSVVSGTQLIRHQGPGGFLQGGSGAGAEFGYPIHFHLGPPPTERNESGALKVRNVAFSAIKLMLARGSSVYLGNIKTPVPPGASDSRIKELIAREQAAHSPRNYGAIDIQESNPNFPAAKAGWPGSKIPFPFAVGPVSSSLEGGGRTATIIGSGGVRLAHGASGSSASIITQQQLNVPSPNPPQPRRMGGSSPAPSQPSPRKQSEKDTITPGKALQYREQIEKLKPGSGQTVTIPGVGWIKAGKNLLGNPVFQYFYPNTIIRMTPEEFRERLKEKSSRTSLNIRPPSPILPEQKYASYNDPTSQIAMAIQPIIIEKPIPVSTGSGSIIAFAPPSISNDKSQSLSRA